MQPRFNPDQDPSNKRKPSRFGQIVQNAAMQERVKDAILDRCLADRALRCPELHSLMAKLTGKDPK